MEDIINALLDVVREQQRSGVPPEAAMSRSDVVNMALKMMQQQGTEIEQETVTETWRTVLRMAPNLFGSDTSDVPPAALSPSEQIIRHMEPDKRITEGNENIQLDKMIFNNFQSMLGGAGGEIKTDSAPEEAPKAPEQVKRPKSAAELAADAIRTAEENKRKGIKPEQPKPGQRRAVTNKKAYKGIPKASNTVKGDASQGVSASQLAYEAQRRAEERAREEARVRAELEAKMAEEAIKRGEPDPRIVAAEEKAKREAAEREMELKRAAERGEAAPPPAEAPKREETPEEKRARVEAEQEARRAREWAEAEAEAKAAKERARAEREAKAMAEAEKAKAEREGRVSGTGAKKDSALSEEEKAAKERAERRAKAREEAQAAKEAKNAQTRLEAAKLIQERAQSKSQKAAQTTKKAVENIQKGMAEALGGNGAELEINEDELNKLVMKKYQEMIQGGTKASDIDMMKLTSMVIEALKTQAEEDEEPIQEDLDDLIEEAWGEDSKEGRVEEEVQEEEPQEESSISSMKQERTIPAERTAEKKEEKTVEDQRKAGKVSAADHKITFGKEERTRRETKEPAPVRKSTAKSVRKPKIMPELDEDTLFSSIRNVKSLMGELENFLNSAHADRRVHTGIEPVDQLLSEGLEPGVYMVQADESIGADSFLLQAGDYMASRGKDVLYLLSDSSRYGMMVKSISRLTYELRGQDKGMARSQASIMNCQSKADMANLRKEFSYYEEKIGEHLYLLEQKTMDSDNMTAIISKLTAAFKKEKETRPVILIDDIYWMLQHDDELLGDLADTAESLEVPIMISIGSGIYEDEDLISTSIQIQYTGAEGDKDKLLQKEIQAENGETLLASLKIIRKDTGKKMSGKMAVTPKYHHFSKATREASLC